MMKLLSVNVGRPQTIARDGRDIVTAIFKTPVEGPVSVLEMNLAGDGQADLRVHGGRNKAVYVYPSEHYPFWRERYPQLNLGWGALGENLTTSGIDETSAHAGDRLRIGTAVFQITRPRKPCFKLAAKFADDAIIPAFTASGRSGFYLSVVKEGIIQAGDAIEFETRHPDGTSIAEILRTEL